jgi:hypothetical protein
MKFLDRLCACGGIKNLISVRDGKLQYRGHELGLPDDNIYNVYRTPDTIKAIKDSMIGLPVTNEHVDTEQAVPEDEIKGNVLTSELVPLENRTTESTVGIKNTVNPDSGLLAEVEAGKRQLSLGYHADTRPYKDGFEQYNIRPHHLAVVDCGRCGSMCSFTDKDKFNENDPNKTIKESVKMPTKRKPSFKDADENGEPTEVQPATLERIAEIAALLPKAVGKIPLEKLNEVMPVLEELIALAGDISTDEPLTEETTEETTEEKQPGMDEDPETEEEKKDKEEEKMFTDKAAFSDAVSKEVNKHMAIIEKARGFLPETYSFTDKTPNRIMRDAIATQSNAKFADSELPTAFKMLQKSNRYKNFADSVADDPFNKIADKEI